MRHADSDRHRTLCSRKLLQVLFVVGPVAILDGFDMEDVRRAVTLIVLLLSLPLYFLLFRPISVNLASSRSGRSRPAARRWRRSTPKEGS